MNPLNYPTDPIIPMILFSAVVWVIIITAVIIWWEGGFDDE